MKRDGDDGNKIYFRLQNAIKQRMITMPVTQVGSISAAL